MCSMFCRDLIRLTRGIRHAIVARVGTGTLSRGNPRLCRPPILELVRQMSLRIVGTLNALWVTSGAVFAGLEVLGGVRSGKDIRSNSHWLR